MFSFEKESGLFFYPPLIDVQKSFLEHSPTPCCARWSVIKSITFRQSTNMQIASRQGYKQMQITHFTFSYHSHCDYFPLLLCHTLLQTLLGRHLCLRVYEISCSVFHLMKTLGQQLRGDPLMSSFFRQEHLLMSFNKVSIISIICRITPLTTFVTRAT